jgi:proteic killer suppression protein
VDISYKDSKLRKLCENSREANRKLGADSAGKLQRRLSELDAADNVDELIAGNPHPLEGDRSAQFSLALAGGKRLVFTPDHDPVPLKDDKGIKWSAVTAVTIIYIGEYHD